MGYYLLRRLLQLVPILLGVAFVFFLIFNVIGGNEKFLYNILPAKGRTPEQIEAYREIYGLNDPLAVQYLRFTRDMFTFNFGISETRKQPVGELLLSKVPVSAVLALPAFFYQIVLALILAMTAVYYRGMPVDRMISSLSVVGMSMPMLALIIFGQTILAYRFQWFPIYGYEPLARSGLGGLKYFALPWILWVVIGLGGNVKFFRTTLLEEVNKDYVRTAWAKGQSQWNIMIFHVLRNALVPILTYVVISIPFLLTGSLLLEKFFSLPGLGDMLLSAVVAYDVPVIKAALTFFTLFFVIFSLITDVLYALVDPRIRLG